MDGLQVKNRIDGLNWNVPKLARESGISQSALYIWIKKGSAAEIKDIFSDVLEKVLSKAERLAEENKG